MANKALADAARACHVRLRIALTQFNTDTSEMIRDFNNLAEQGAISTYTEIGNVAAIRLLLEQLGDEVEAAQREFNEALPQGLRGFPR